MTKSELIRLLTKKHQSLYLKDVTLLVDTILEEISKALARGDRVEIRGFGSFSARKRKARTARNPKTNEVVYLNERSAPYFRAGKELRERLNEGSSSSSSSSSTSGSTGGYEGEGSGGYTPPSPSGDGSGKSWF